MAATEINPFLDVSVVPAYGKKQATIIWRMSAGFEDGKFVILKSEDGINGWRDIGAVDHGNSFIDEDVITNGKLELLYYKVVLQKNSRRYDSSVINTLGTLSRAEFGAARWIMLQEYLKLSQCTRILICKMKINARPCPACTDADSGQAIGVALCKVCYGTTYEGGFWPPMVSFMQLLSQDAKVQIDNPSGAGSDDTFHCKVRMLAYPQLIKNDMIVDPLSDKRYLVETQDISYLKGKCPLVATAGMVLLRRSSVKYTFPV